MKKSGESKHDLVLVPHQKTYTATDEYPQSSDTTRMPAKKSLDRAVNQHHDIAWDKFTLATHSTPTSVSVNQHLVL